MSAYQSLGMAPACSCCSCGICCAHVPRRTRPVLTGRMPLPACCAQRALRDYAPPWVTWVDDPGQADVDLLHTMERADLKRWAGWLDSSCVAALARAGSVCSLDGCFGAHNGVGGPQEVGWLGCWGLVVTLCMCNECMYGDWA